jgi:hypothetical protein
MYIFLQNLPTIYNEYIGPYFFIAPRCSTIFACELPELKLQIFLITDQCCSQLQLAAAVVAAAVEGGIRVEINKVCCK